EVPGGDEVWEREFLDVLALCERAILIARLLRLESEKTAAGYTGRAAVKIGQVRRVKAVRIAGVEDACAKRGGRGGHREVRVNRLIGRRHLRRSHDEIDC